MKIHNNFFVVLSRALSQSSLCNRILAWTRQGLNWKLSTVFSLSSVQVHCLSRSKACKYTARRERTRQNQRFGSCVRFQVSLCVWNYTFFLSSCLVGGNFSALQYTKNPLLTISRLLCKCVSNFMMKIFNFLFRIHANSPSHEQQKETSCICRNSRLHVSFLLNSSRNFPTWHSICTYIYLSSISIHTTSFLLRQGSRGVMQRNELW